MNNNDVAEQLRQLTRIYNQTLDERKKFVMRLNRKTPYLLESASEYESAFESMIARNKENEAEIKKKIDTLVKQHPWYAYLNNIKGVSSIISATLIGELCGYIYGALPAGAKDTDLPPLYSKGPRPFERTSDLWAFCGFAVKDGKAARRTKGEAAKYNRHLKQIGFHFGECQIRANGPYRKYYDERKVFEQEHHADLSKGYIHNRARRYMIKKFLSDVKHDLIDGQHDKHTETLSSSQA